MALAAATATTSTPIAPTMSSPPKRIRVWCAKSPAARPQGCLGLAATAAVAKPCTCGTVRSNKRRHRGEMGWDGWSSEAHQRELLATRSATTCRNRGAVPAVHHIQTRTPRHQVRQGAQTEAMGWHRGTVGAQESNLRSQGKFAGGVARQPGRPWGRPWAHFDAHDAS